MEYNIAIIGEQASGKTTCVRLLKGLHIEKRYFKTFAAEASPMDILKDTLITVWDMPSENYEKYMHKMHGVIYVTKKPSHPVVELTIPHVVVDNRGYRMNRDSLLKAYGNLCNIITKGEYLAYIRQSRASVAS
jgi:hypothetical protein